MGFWIVLMGDLIMINIYYTIENNPEKKYIIQYHNEGHQDNKGYIGKNGLIMNCKYECCSFYLWQAEIITGYWNELEKQLLRPNNYGRYVVRKIDD